MLDITGLEFERPGFSVDVDLALGDGELGVLLGPSGCGKSTVLRLVAGLLHPSRGRIRLLGRDITALPPEARRVGLVFQDFALFGHLSAAKNIEYGPKVAGLDRRAREARTAELAAAFHIERLLPRQPASLSGGEQQRVALARSLAAKPDLLLLDEPLSSLDAALRRELRGEIRERVKAAGVGALLVTHDVEEALAMADRLFLMKGGRILDSGRPEELYERPRTAFTARLMGRGPLIPLRALSHENGEAKARTDFGDFRCQLPGDGGGSPLFLHFAADAVRPTSRELGEDILSGSVVSSVYLGRARRVTLAPIAGLNAGGTEEEGAIEIEVPPAVRPEAGERLHFEIPSEAMSLIP
jgi:ABC-type Fe3+/spermidine/putrescine transport system ATPase subunit